MMRFLTSISPSCIREPSIFVLTFSISSFAPPGPSSGSSPQLVGGGIAPPQFPRAGDGRGDERLGGGDCFRKRVLHRQEGGQRRREGAARSVHLAGGQALAPQDPPGAV